MGKGKKKVNEVLLSIPKVVVRFSEESALFIRPGRKLMRYNQISRYSYGRLCRMMAKVEVEYGELGVFPGWDDSTLFFWY